MGRFTSQDKLGKTGLIRSVARWAVPVRVFEGGKFSFMGGLKIVETCLKFRRDEVDFVFGEVVVEGQGYGSG